MKTKFTSKTSWREKLERVQEPKIVDIPPNMQNRFGRGKMLIPKPLDVDTQIRKVKKGRLATITEIRNKLAKDFKVDVTCPLTTGIFVRIISEASEEDLEKGNKNNTPYWRIIRDDGSLIEKFPGNLKRQSTLLTNEGHTIIKNNNKKLPAIKDFEKKLMRF